MPLSSSAYAGTRITEPPTLSGRAGEAWRVQLPPLGHRGRPDCDATVGFYIVHRPGAHAFWDHWAVTLVHLRPIAGVKPASKRFAGATHEFLIASLNPQRPLPSLDSSEPGWGPSFLTPIDVVEQFAARDDAVADQILELGVRAIVDGLASPDQDWRAWWTQAIEQTAAHYADGTHQVPRA